MIKINDKVLSNEEIVTMLGERITRPIDFQLTEQFQSTLKYILPSGDSKWITRYQETFGLSNNVVVRNFKDGGNDTLIYYNNVIEPTKNSPERRYIVGDTLNKIEFTRGRITVNEGQEDLLLFLRFHEQNKTNKYWMEADAFGNQKYRPTRGFLFKEIMPTVEAATAYDTTHNLLRAQTACFDPKRIPFDSAIIMATGYGMPDARHSGEKAVRQFLYKQATSNPSKFLEDMQSATFDIQAIVQSALVFKIIKFDAPYYAWCADAPKKYGDGRICQVPTGKEPIAYFTEWLRITDKSGVMEEIKMQVANANEKADGSFIEQEERPGEAILTMLGVTSIDEAINLIYKGRQKPEAGGLKQKGNSNFGKGKVAKKLSEKKEISLTAENP